MKKNEHYTKSRLKEVRSFLEGIFGLAVLIISIWFVYSGISYLKSNDIIASIKKRIPFVKEHSLIRDHFSFRGHPIRYTLKNGKKAHFLGDEFYVIDYLQENDTWFLAVFFPEEEFKDLHQLVRTSIMKSFNMKPAIKKLYSEGGICHLKINMTKQSQATECLINEEDDLYVDVVLFRLGDKAEYKAMLALLPYMPKKRVGNQNLSSKQGDHRLISE